MASYILIFTTGLLLAATLLPLMPSSHWFFRGWEFPRVQLLVLLLLNLLACSIFLQNATLWTSVVLNIMAMAYQIIWILPYTRLVPLEVRKCDRGGISLKIMTSNVLMTNRDASRLLGLVHDHEPDVLVTLETDQWWQDQLAPIEKLYPYTVCRPLDNLYGMHVFSKFALEDIEVCELIQEGIPSIHCYLRLNDSVKVRCHFIHPAPPSPTENTYAKARDKELLWVARQVTPGKEPTIVTGDLNDVAWSPTTREFRVVSELLDPRIGRGFFNTFHADHKFIRWPLDHLFHSDDFYLRQIHRLPPIGSDHFPLLTHLVYRDGTEQVSASR